jgi:hypothetical protein
METMRRKNPGELEKNFEIFDGKIARGGGVWYLH